MKSGWLVRHAAKYEVYRLKDALEPDGETEIDSEHEKRDDAVARAKELNRQEAERFWRGC